MRVSRTMRVLTGAVLIATLTVGCGGSGDSGGSSSASGGGGGGSEKKDLTFGVIPGWTDQVGTAYLAKNVLEKNGYKVKIVELSDNAPMYTALSRGNIDVNTSGWIDLTHKSYWDKYSKDLEDIGVYYEGATSFLAVPTYMTDINSIEDLPGKSAEFNGVITGIEPGAGLTKMTKEKVIPGYGLDKDYKLVLSSTVAMLTSLKKATNEKKPIVITMWKPFWANSSFPIKALEDPKGLYGKPENLHVIAHKGFSEEAPKATNMLKAMKLDQKQYESLENTIVNKFPKGQEAQAVSAWLKENPDYAPKLEAALK